VIGCLSIREEFEKHGLGGVVTSTCRDVCTEGFGLANIADAGTISTIVAFPWILPLYTSVSGPSDAMESG